MLVAWLVPVGSNHEVHFYLSGDNQPFPVLAGMLAPPVVVILLSLLINRLAPLGDALVVLLFFVFLVLLSGWLWLVLALHAKRLRDAGLSPWNCLLFFVPLAGLVVFLIAGFKPTAVKRTGAPTR